jgi:hypothetical protein
MRLNKKLSKYEKRLKKFSQVKKVFGISKNRSDFYCEIVDPKDHWMKILKSGLHYGCYSSYQNRSVSYIRWGTKIILINIKENSDSENEILSRLKSLPK